jgi:hypothetical protein
MSNWIVCRQNRGVEGYHRYVKRELQQCIASNSKWLRSLAGRRSRLPAKIVYVELYMRRRLWMVSINAGLRCTRCSKEMGGHGDVLNTYSKGGNTKLLQPLE